MPLGTLRRMRQLLTRPLTRGRRNLMGFPTLGSAIALVLGIVIVGTLGVKTLDFALPLSQCVVTPVLAAGACWGFAVTFARDLDRSQVCLATDALPVNVPQLVLSNFFHGNIFHLFFCVLSLWSVAKAEEESSEFYFAMYTALFLLVPSVTACFLDKSLVEYFETRGNHTSSQLLFLPLFKRRRTLGLGNAVLAWTAAAAMTTVDAPAASILSSAGGTAVANASAISPQAAAAAAAAAAFAAANGAAQRATAAGTSGPGVEQFGPDNHFILHPLAVFIVLHVICPHLSLSASLASLALGIFVGVGGTSTLYWFSVALLWAILGARVLVESARQKEPHRDGPRAVANGVDVATGRPVRGLGLHGGGGRLGRDGGRGGGGGGGGGGDGDEDRDGDEDEAHARQIDQAV